MTNSHREVPVRTIGATIGMVLLTVLVLLVIMATRRILIWIMVAAFFAVALSPAVNWLERRFRWCRRSLATLLVFLVVVLVVGGLIAAFVVPLVREGTALAQQVPNLITDARAGRGTIGQLLERFHVLEYAQRNQSQLKAAISGLGASAVSVLRGAATSVAGGITILVLAYLMVLQMPKIVSSTLALFSAEHAQRIQRVGAACAKTVTGYLTGNLLISVICGALTYIALLIFNVPYPLLIALFVALADLIPLVGATLGAVVAAVAAFSHSLTAGIAIIIFFVVYQQVENHLLQPVIMSRTVKLNPLTVLVSVLIAVELAGILGALLAIPVAGVLQVIARDVWDSRRGRLRGDSGAEPTPTPAAPATPVVADTIG